MTTPVWKRILKWSAWLLGGLLALPILGYVVLLLVNLRDQPPSEAALRMAADYRNRPAVADADNAYVYAMGFPVAPGADPQEAGLRRIAWIRAFQPETQYPPEGDPVRSYDGHNSSRPAAGQKLSACAIGSKDCIAALESGDDELRSWITSEQWLLDRYLTLVQHPGWLETLPYDPRAPMLFDKMLWDGQKLLIAQAYVQAGQNNATAVRELLGKDARFWRSVLASSDILITKMVAAAALRRTWITGNLVLRRLPAEFQLAAVPQEWTQPLTDTERSMLRCLIGEWIYSNDMLDQIVAANAQRYALDEDDVEFFDTVLGQASRPLFKLQDAKNRRAEAFIRASEAMNVPIENFAASLEQARAIYHDSHTDPNLFANLYNPLDRLLMLIAADTYASYPPRINDVEGVRRATVLTTELRARKVAQENLAAELAVSQIRTPYNGQPFTWDAKDRAIVFVGMEPGERGRHALTY